MREPDDEGIRLYLLGLMPETDAEAVEEAYFARPEVFERVRAAEDDLLDDYAAGRLAPAEKAAFEGRYLASSPLRQRVLAARALRLAAPAALGERDVTPIAVRRTPRWTQPLAIAAGLLIALAATWLWRSDTPPVTSPVPAPSVARVETPPPPEPTPTASPSASASPILPAPTRLAFALSPTLLRGEGGPAQVRVSSDGATLVFELQGDPAMVPRGSRLGAAIETVEGSRVFHGAARRGGRPGSALVASVEVPAAQLAPGDYLLTLTAGDQTLYRYFFRVPAR